MGLRMWQDPDDEVVADDAATKLDRAAASRRSTIRREPSVRPGRDNASRESLSLFLRNRQQNMLRARDRLRQEERETDSQIAHLQNELERLRRVRIQNRTRIHSSMQMMARAGRESTSPSSTSDQPSDHPTSDQRAESNSDESADSGNQLPPPRPPRESNLRFEFLPSGISRSSSPWRYQVLSRALMPSPPQSADSEVREQPLPEEPSSESRAPNNDDVNMPALTEGFAPARAASRGSWRRPESHGPDDDFRGLETPPPESWESSYPPLQRVGHLSLRNLPRVDGLGDRRRSLSPLSDANEEDTWMSNLLTTMDTSRSSSATSFASTGSEAARRSHPSSQTTTTSFGEVGSADETCDLDLPEGITEDDVRMIRERHRPQRNRDRLTGPRSYREHMDRIGDMEIGYFHAILERMRRQEPIPEDWWSTVGLPPDFGREP